MVNKINRPNRFNEEIMIRASKERVDSRKACLRVNKTRTKLQYDLGRSKIVSKSKKKKVSLPKLTFMG